jgi:hypothetical protein
MRWPRAASYPVDEAYNTAPTPRGTMDEVRSWRRRIRELLPYRKVGAAKPTRDVFAPLPKSARSLAILAGAGVSPDSPANLLAGWDFMDSVLSRILPDEICEDFRRSLIQVPQQGWKSAAIARRNTALHDYL